MKKQELTKSLSKWVETKSEEKENERQRKLSVLMEEERAAFLNAACTSAGVGYLGTRALNQVPRWNDLVFIEVR